MSEKSIILKKEILFGGKNLKKYLYGIFEANDTINSLITFKRIY